MTERLHEVSSQTIESLSERIAQIEDLLKKEAVTEKMKPTIETLSKRLTQLEKLIEEVTTQAEAFTREKPICALKMTLIAGMFLGFIIGTTAFRRHD